MMFLSALNHPAINPVLISVGPVQIHWYGVAYVVGILFGWWYARKLATTNSLWGKSGSPITAIDIDDFIVWAVIGIILGGRLGYVLFYEFQSYISEPLSVFKIWQGGMSFHGGLAGVTLAMILFARRRGFSILSLFDVIAASTCIGILLGRIANFINAELYGRETDAPWGVIFPDAGNIARHPSQLYEAGLEGLALFLLLAVLTWKFRMLRRPGMISGSFLIGYGLSRIFVEFFRLPDPQLGYLAGGWLTMGMILSVPWIILGLFLAFRSRVPPAA